MRRLRRWWWRARAALSREPWPPPKYPYEERWYGPRWTAVAEDCGTADFLRPTEHIFEPYDLVMVDRTHELFQVREAMPLFGVKIVRGLGGTRADIRAGDELVIVGRAEPSA